MASRANLRAVDGSGKAPAQRRKKHTVVSAAAEGDRLDLAIATRDRLARAIDGECSPRDLAALTKRLDDVVEKIAVLQAAKQEGGDDADDDEDGDEEAFDPSSV